MNILVCNVGSTSLKYQLFDSDFAVLARGGAERVGTEKSVFYVTENGEKQFTSLPLPTHLEAIEAMLRALGGKTPDCVAFKVVHARGVTGTQYLTDEVLSAMEAFNTVAPAHNPPYLAAIRLFRKAMPGVPLIGAFETAFHADLPKEASLYSIPISVSRKYDIHRYGFHGASHEYLSRFAAERLGKGESKIISCHLGGSGSICAVKNGKSVDTSMGLSLQCGVMHNNRCGDIDPYVIFYLAKDGGMTLDEIQTMLETKSGFLGMTDGLSGDVRDVEKAAKEGNEDAETALKSYAYSIRKYVGAYAAAMGGVDAIVFGGGIGTGSAAVRALALSGLSFIGIELDPDKNRAGCEDISKDGSRVRIFLTETNEERIVAEKAAALLGQ
ncbi:MAG: acetate/propionate family kinase [Oscillospiraceae bacterium]|nr:acetate/propionate family kinase [Oscillospiraceae bacterium]